MAGDWIKVEVVTPDKPEVFAIAESLNIDSDAAFGKLFRVWAWADQHLEETNAESVSNSEKTNAAIVSRSLIDKIAGVKGFADAMISCGWLEQVGSGLVFTNIERHNGQTAKKRALTARRVAKHEKSTNAKPNAVSVSRELVPALAKEDIDKDIDIKVVVDTREEPKSDPVETAPANTQAQVVIQEWNLLGEPFPACLKLTDKRRTALRQRLSDPEWSRTWRQALDRLKAAKFARGENKSGWVADIDFFLRPDSVVKILEGKYDNGESRQQQRTFEHRGPDRRFNSGQVYDPNADTSEIIV